MSVHALGSPVSQSHRSCRRGDPMRRRDAIVALGGAAVWPLVARAQQAALPVVGFVSGGSPAPFARIVAAFRQGLREAGYTEGHNVVIQYRWAGGRYPAASGVSGPVPVD